MEGNGEMVRAERAEISRSAETPALEFKPEQRQLIRDSFANGASDSEFAVLMEIAKARRLNPLLRQIHFVKRWDSQKNRDVWAPQVSIDGLRAIAQRTGLYAGQDEAEFGPATAEGYPEWARVKVYRTDWPRPAVGVAYWSEFVQTYRDKQTGKQRPTPMWLRMPRVMLAKVAESQALRKAFPEDMSGLYSDAEMAQASSGEGDETEPKRALPPSATVPSLKVIDAPQPAAEEPTATAPQPQPEPPAEMPPTLAAFLGQANAMELPGEAVALWLKYRRELGVLPPSDREAAWKALCKRTEDVGRMKNARVWLKKAIAEADAKHGERPDEPPPDDGPRGGGRPAPTSHTDAHGAAQDAAPDLGGPLDEARPTNLALVPDWLATEATTRAHLATKTHVASLENSVRLHGKVGGERYLSLATARLEALTPPDHRGLRASRETLRARVDGWAAMGPKRESGTAPLRRRAAGGSR